MGPQTLGHRPRSRADRLDDTDVDDPRRLPGAGRAAASARALLALGTRLKRIFTTPPLRAALLELVDALDAGDPAAAFVDPERGTPTADRDFFRAMRDTIVATPRQFLPALKAILDGDPVPQIDAPTFGT